MTTKYVVQVEKEAMMEFKLVIDSIGLDLLHRLDCEDCFIVMVECTTEERDRLMTIHGCEFGDNTASVALCDASVTDAYIDSHNGVDAELPVIDVDHQ